jgi:WD40 repeat protein
MSFELSQVSYRQASKTWNGIVQKDSTPLLSSLPLSSLFTRLKVSPPELTPEIIHDPEQIKTIVHNNTDTIVGGCSSGLIIIWRNKVRAIHYQYKSPITCIVHSVNSRKVYAGCENGSVVRWSYTLPPDKAVGELPSKKNPITSLLIYKNDSIILGGRSDGKIHMWVLNIKRPPFELIEHVTAVTGLQVNEKMKEMEPDTDLKLFSSDLEGNIVVWNIEDVGSHHVMHKLKCEYGIQRILICGEFLMSADIKGHLVKWNLDDYSVACSIEFTSAVKNMCVSQDNLYLFCALASLIDYSIKVVNIERMETEKPFSIKAHDSQIFDICTIPGTDKVLTSSKDETLKVWDFSENYEFSFLFNKQNDINSMFICESTRIICTGDSYGKIELFDLEGRKKTRELYGITRSTVTCLIVTEDNKYIIAAFEDQRIIGWAAKANSKDFLFKFDGPDAHTEKVNHLCTSIDNKQLFSVSSDRTIKVWSIVMQSLVKTLGLNKPNDPKKEEKGVKNTNETKTEEKSHQNDIIDIKVTKNLIISASDDGFIIVWELSTFKQIKKLEFGAKIYSLGVSQLENAIVAAGKSKDIKVWYDFLGQQFTYNIQGHSDSILKVFVYGQTNLIYSCSTDQTIKIWSLDQGILLFSTLIPDLKDFFVPSSQSYIYAIINTDESEQYTVKKIKNIIFGDEVSVYPPKYSYFFKLYVNKVELQEIKSYDPKWQDYLIFPHIINLAFVFIQANKSYLLKQGINSGLKFIKNSQNDSPLSWALFKNNNQCADVLVKKLSKMNLKSEKVIIEMIEKQMNQLFSTNLSCLPLLFDNLFERLEENVEATGRLRKSAPMIISTLTKTLEQDYFIDTGSFSHKKEFLEFRRSLCRFNIEIGSFDSLRLLNSITDCYNSELFRSQMLKAFLLFKWRQNFFLLIIETIIYCISLGLLVFYILSKDKLEMNFVLIILMIFNTYNVLQNLTKCSDSILKFFKSPWNLLDLSRIVLSYYYTIKQLAMHDSSHTGLELLTLFYCLKAVGYFRIFNKYRYLLRVILEIIKDMTPFFLILFTSTLAFAILLRVSESELTFFNSFINVYMLDQTNFVISLNSFENIFVFFMASLLNPIIMLNLLIAIMGDTYDRIQEDMVVADYREMTELILEAEYFVFWRKFRPGTMAYITRCDYLRNLNLEKNEWMGKIRAVKKSIQALEGKFKATGRNIDKVQIGILDKLKDVASSSSSLNKRLKDLRSQ